MTATNKQTSLGDPSFQRLLTCLEQIRHKLTSGDADFVFLCNYFQSNDFEKLFKVHNTVLTEDETKCNPVSESATNLADEVAETISSHAAELVEVQELQYLLRKPHLKALLKTHDCIASNDYTLENVEDNMYEEVLVEFALRPEKQSNVDTEGSDHNYKSDELTTTVIEVQNDDKNAPVDTAVEENHNAELALDELQQVPFDNESSALQSTNNSQESLTEEINEQGHETGFQNKELKVAAVMANGNKRDYPLEVKISEVTGHGLSHTDCEGQESVNNRKELGVKEVIGDMVEHTSKKEMTKPPLTTNGHKTGHSVDAKTSKQGFRTVRVFRGTKETLGVTVKVVDNTESILVARILSGGLADTSGSLHAGDEIIEINGGSVRGMTANEVAELMDKITGSVKIKIVPARNEKKFTREAKMSVRAFFDYDPVDDPLIPCKEVGVAFKRGDVLHVLSLEDPNWWQARKDGCSRYTTGLIPSKDFQEKRQRCLKIDEGRQKEKNNTRPSLPFPKWKRKKTDSNKLLCNFQQDVKKEEFPVYEQVAKYLESSEKKRPLLLIGPSGVGRNELKKMLLSSNPDKFTTTVPHTSRLKRPYETNDRDYFFVSRQTMESFIQNGKLIEFGEYKGSLYGTSKDSIKRAMKSGKTCVLKVEPEVALLLRSADFKPFCVYIKPPSLQDLRSSRLTVTSKSSKGNSSLRTFQDEDLQEMITESEVLEDSYGHLFDLTVVNKDLEPAYSTILEAVDKLQQQPQWVPVDWTQDK